jgi:hypothetical protein
MNRPRNAAQELRSLGTHYISEHMHSLSDKDSISSAQRDPRGEIRHIRACRGGFKGRPGTQPSEASFLIPCALSPVSFFHLQRPEVKNYIYLFTATLMIAWVKLFLC